MKIKGFRARYRCTHGNNCLYRHADGEEKPSKKSKKESTQGAVAILKENMVQGCVSKLISKEVYSAESWANEIERFGEKIRRTKVRNSNSGE